MKDGVTDLCSRKTLQGASLRTGKVTPSFLIWSLLGLLVLGGIVAVLRWEDDPQDTPVSPGPKTPPIMAEDVQKVRVREPQTGRLAWEFSAKRITVDASHVWTTATDVRDAVIYREGKPYLQLQAREVRLNQQTRDVDATGSVHAKLPQGFTIQTQRALWTHQLGRLEANGTVKAQGRDGLIIQTQRAVWTQRHSQLEASGGVRAQTRDGMTVQTDRAVWTEGPKRLEATGNVSAQGRDGFSVRTQRAIWLHPRRRLEVLGNVTAQGRDGFMARTQRAVWSQNDSRLEVPGAVTATLRGMTFNTRVIAYDARSGRLNCPQPFQMEASGITISGARAGANARRQIVESHGGVKIVIRPSALPPGMIR